jgi:hypothetical protein
MEILVLQVFVSLVLVAGSVLLFAHFVRLRDIDHADRLALIPVEDDDPPSESACSGGSTGASPEVAKVGTKTANERVKARTNASQGAEGQDTRLGASPLADEASVPSPLAVRGH